MPPVIPPGDEPNVDPIAAMKTISTIFVVRTLMATICVTASGLMSPKSFASKARSQIDLNRSGRFGSLSTSFGMFATSVTRNFGTFNAKESEKSNNVLNSGTLMSGGIGNVGKGGGIAGIPGNFAMSFGGGMIFIASNGGFGIMKGMKPLGKLGILKLTPSLKPNETGQQMGSNLKSDFRLRAQAIFSYVPKMFL